jgi:hypothetical protein
MVRHFSGMRNRCCVIGKDAGGGAVRILSWIAYFQAGSG